MQRITITIEDDLLAEIDAAAKARIRIAPLRGYSLGNVALWHIAAPDVCDGTSAVGDSRHRIPKRIRWSTD